MCLRRGIPLEDMEFYQFHPTGIYGIGILLSEAARGEGAILLNGEGERFMERYAPTIKDLAPRDMVSRAIYQEIAEGRGVGGKDFVHLDVRHLPVEVIETKLPDITEFARLYLGVEPTTELVPIQPTAHYAMGGIPTDVEAQVVVDSANSPLPGLYAAGECACSAAGAASGWRSTPQPPSSPRSRTTRRPAPGSCWRDCWSARSAGRATSGSPRSASASRTR